MWMTLVPCSSTNTWLVKKTPNKIGRIKYTDRNYTTPYNIIVKVQQSEKEKEIGGKSWRSSVKKK